MKRMALLLAIGLLAWPGCGSHRQHYRPDPEPRSDRVNNGESPTVQNWSTGER